jgi:hypothetical protein
VVGIRLDGHFPPARRAGTTGDQSRRELVQVLELVQLELTAQRLELAREAVLARILRRVGELRDHDRGKDAEDDHDDQNFDERETTLRPTKVSNCVHGKILL